MKKFLNKWVTFFSNGKRLKTNENKNAKFKCPVCDNKRDFYFEVVTVEDGSKIDVCVCNRCGSYGDFVDISYAEFSGKNTTSRFNKHKAKRKGIL